MAPPGRVLPTDSRTEAPGNPPCPPKQGNPSQIQSGPWPNSLDKERARLGQIWVRLRSWQSKSKHDWLGQLTQDGLGRTKISRVGVMKAWSLDQSGSKTNQNQTIMGHDPTNSFKARV